MSFSGSRIALGLLCFLMLAGSSLPGWAQSLTVKGKVTDSGEGIPGVNISIRGTSTGTVTDVQGDYSLQVPSGDAVLVFSSIGYESQEIPVNGRATINVDMAVDVQQLNEVVVVGYGTQKKSDLTGAITSIETKQITERGATSPVESIQGQLPGVNISASSGQAGSGYTFQIRGVNSLAGGNPLFVVDGSIVPDINFLNPQDIARIDVLKDASSTAIYGSRGSNGVVIITTKSGNAGGNPGATISYDGYVGVREAARLPEFMDGQEWWEYRQNAYIASPLISGKPYDNTVGGIADSDVLRQRIAANQTTDWPGYFLQTGLQMNHWLSVSGNSSNGMSYTLGGGYQKEKGNIINEEYDRYNFKAAVDHKISDQWSAGANVNLSISTHEIGSENAILNAFRMSPLVTPYDSLGNLLYQPGKYAGISFTSSVNPLWEMMDSRNNTRTFTGVGNLYLQYAPVSWLRLRSTFAPNLRNERVGIYYGPNTERNKQGNPSGSMERNEYFSYNWDNVVTVDQNYNGHNFTFTGLYSLYYNQLEGSYLDVINLPFNSLYYNLGTAATDKNNIQEISTNYSKVSLISYMGRLNYNWRDRYFVTVASRWDGSSKLAQGYKWGAFPSAALAWRISEESFMQNITPISNLKLRLSYGFTGNNNVDPYITQVYANTQRYYDYGGSVAGGLAPSGVVNPLLTWEKTREVNVGMDYDLLQGRISGTVDVYNKLSSDLLIERNLPIESGWTSLFDNVGSVRNKGVEIALRTVNIRTDAFSWTTSFNFTRNKNEIVELINGKEDMVGNQWFIGQPIDVNYTYVFDGIWQESDRELARRYNALPGQPRIKDINSDSAITSADRTIIGSPFPKWQGGFNTQVTYKGFDLSLSLFAVQGKQVFSPFHDEFLNFTDRGRAKLDVDYYMSPNDVTPTRVSNEYPMPNNVGSYWRGESGVGAYKDASYVKVKNIVLGYNVPSPVLERFKLKSLRLYANVLNPFVFTKYDGFDPEWAEANLGRSGISTVTYQFGINLKL